MELIFVNPTDMIAWLKDHNIDTTNWEQGPAKGTAELWAEYQAGETSFANDPPSRQVEVMEVIIRRGNRVLIELEQELRDGRRRSRNRPPSEKLKPGETLDEAALRCLVEELDLSPDNVTTFPDGRRTASRTAESQSYPGLQTRYTVYTVEAMADGLPDVDFWRDNQSGPSDPVFRHKWGWRTAEEESAD